MAAMEIKATAIRPSQRHFCAPIKSLHKLPMLAPIWQYGHRWPSILAHNLRGVYGLIFAN